MPRQPLQLYQGDTTWKTEQNYWSTGMKLRNAFIYSNCVLSRASPTSDKTWSRFHSSGKGGVVEAQLGPSALFQLWEEGTRLWLGGGGGGGQGVKVSAAALSLFSWTPAAAPSVSDDFPWSPPPSSDWRRIKGGAEVMVGSPVRLSELDVESHIALVWQPRQQTKWTQTLFHHHWHGGGKCECRKW